MNAGSPDNIDCRSGTQFPCLLCDYDMEPAHIIVMCGQINIRGMALRSSHDERCRDALLRWLLYDEIRHIAVLGAARSIETSLRRSAGMRTCWSINRAPTVAADRTSRWLRYPGTAIGSQG